MKEITDVTIIGNNINVAILDNYKEYQLITKNFLYEELMRYKRVIFYNVLNNMDDSKVKELFNFLRSNKINFINVTNRVEHSLLTKNIIVYKDNEIYLEGITREIYNNPKKIEKLGLDLPFTVELSSLLKYYDLVDKIYYDKESLVDKLWN